MISKFKIGTFRWRICALLFFAATINYIDRLVFGMMAPVLTEVFHWTNANYTDFLFWFDVAYVIGLVSFGEIFVVIGGRKELILIRTLGETVTNSDSPHGRQLAVNVTTKTRGMFLTELLDSPRKPRHALPGGYQLLACRVDITMLTTACQTGLAALRSD